MGSSVVFKLTGTGGPVWIASWDPGDGVVVECGGNSGGAFAARMCAPKPASSTAMPRPLGRNRGDSVVASSKGPSRSASPNIRTGTRGPMSPLAVAEGWVAADPFARSHAVAQILDPLGYGVEQVSVFEYGEEVAYLAAGERTEPNQNRRRRM